MSKDIKEMTPERIKEIQSKTAYPQSVSVQQALLQVWNECEQHQQQKIEELQREVEIERKHKRKYRSLADNFLEKNYKLKEQVRELEELNNEVQKVWNEDEEIKWKTPIAWYRVLRISDKLLTK